MPKFSKKPARKVVKPAKKTTQQKKKVQSPETSFEEDLIVEEVVTAEVHHEDDVSVADAPASPEKTCEEEDQEVQDVTPVITRQESIQSSVRSSSPLPSTSRATGHHDVSPSSSSDEASSTTSSARQTSQPQQPSQQKGKKLRGTLIQLSEAVEEELVGWIQENPSVYDKSHPQYKDRTRKDRLFVEKAASLGISATDLKKWCSSMRTTAGRSEELPTGTGRRDADAKTRPRDAWIKRAFAFLAPSIARKPGRRAGRSLLPDQPQQQSKKRRTSNVPRDTSTPMPLHEEPVGEDDLGMMRQQLDQLIQAVSQQLSEDSHTTPEHRGRRLFMESVYEGLKDLPNDLWMEF